MDRCFFRFVTMQACDRQTERQTERINIARQRLHSYNVDIIIINLNKKIWTDISSVLSQCKRVTDGWSDRQTDEQNSHYVNLAKLSFVWYKNLDRCFFSFCHNTRV